jgi:chemotaxis protein MotA
MDLATIVGIFSAFALVLLAMASGGGLGIFLDWPSVLIVCGGTLGVTLVNYTMSEVVSLVAVTRRVFFHRLEPIPRIISQFMELSIKARRDGILALEAQIMQIRDPFMGMGMTLALDGVAPENIKEILQTEIDRLAERHRLGAEMFTTMGTFAPALGMIGTLIGLVQMLRSMEDPSRIGPAMAVAIITTFYGAVLANLLFLPMSGKLKNRSAQEVNQREMVMQGILGIARGDNPRVIEQRLLCYLPPASRRSMFK